VRASSVVSARLYILEQLVTLLLVRASVISLPQSKQAASKQSRALLQAAAANSRSKLLACDGKASFCLLGESQL